MYIRSGKLLFPGGGSSKSILANSSLNQFIWFAPELLCLRCNSFLEGSTLPDGKCGVCGLPPHYSRTERKVTRMGNRYHCTTSYTSLRLDVDLFVIHAMFRSIALRSYYAGHGRSVPINEAWNMAISESKPIISKLLQYGCTKLEHFPRVPLTSIGIPGKTVLLLRNILWHINHVLKCAQDNSPYEFTMRPPPRDLQWQQKQIQNNMQRRPKTAPLKQHKGRRESTKLKRPKTSEGIRKKKNYKLKDKKGSPMKKKERKKSSKTSQIKTRNGQNRQNRQKNHLLPEILEHNPALRESWKESEMTPSKQYSRPKTAPIWKLGGSLFVER